VGSGSPFWFAKTAKTGDLEKGQKKAANQAVHISLKSHSKTEHGAH
jgi:hypothetical protein